ncbi:MAG: hypothetical protein KGI78_02815 [Patescibacteria group bacterium]|nr:hypothetical protein [Patescibacteria group bacterium]MDE2057761.1 hypothetical protein [Patescibacteria group bacterium]
MDGRCQAVVGAWARTHFSVDHPDTVTIAGADGVLVTDPAEWERALAMATISAEKHGARGAIIAGHSGCAGFVASPEEHQDAIRGAVAKLVATGLFESVVGVYHDVDTDEIIEVCRSAAVPATAVA